MLTTARLVLVDQLADLTQDPTIAPIRDPIFIGSWAELGFDLGASGLSPDQVHFVVPAGLDVGFVSYARPEGSSRPVPLLVVGGKTGVHEVRLVKNAGNTVLATAPFEITDHWRDSDTGPPGFYATNSRFGGDSGWGGGPGTPQNMFNCSRTTAPGARCADGRHRLGPLADRRRDDGRQSRRHPRPRQQRHPFDGDARSARIYYEENSDFPVEHTAPRADDERQERRGLRPGQPAGRMDRLFRAEQGRERNVTSAKWWSKGTTLQTIIARAIDDGVATTADFTDLDVLIVVLRSPDAAPAAGDRFVWPHAHPTARVPVRDQRG